MDLVRPVRLDSAQGIVLMSPLLSVVVHWMWTFLWICDAFGFFIAKCVWETRDDLLFWLCDPFRTPCIMRT